MKIKIFWEVVYLSRLKVQIRKQTKTLLKKIILLIQTQFNFFWYKQPKDIEYHGMKYNL